MSTLTLRIPKGSPITSLEMDTNLTNLNNDKQEVNQKDATGGYAGLTSYKINFKNASGLNTSFLTHSNTAARTYTFPDKDMVVADNADIVAMAIALG